MKKHKVIAIIGSAKPNRSDPPYDPPLRDADKAKEAAEQLGKELARNGFRIMVYSSSPDYIEGDIVRGYASHTKAPMKGIIVHYPHDDADVGTFPEKSNRSDLFDLRPHTSKAWEVSFYRSLKEADGFLLIGGGKSTFISGLIAIAYRIPILTLSYFGGAATRVWKLLTGGVDLPTDDEHTLMGTWQPDRRAAYVKVLQTQIKRRANEALEEQQDAESRRTLWASLFAIVLALLIILAAALGLFLVDVQSFIFLFLLLSLGALTGTFGALIKRLWNKVDLNLSAMAWTSVMGLAAGIVASFLYIVAQVTVNPGLIGWGATEGELQGNPRFLLLFTMIIGFIAGFTFDKLFRRLSEMDALKPGSFGLPDTTSSTGKSTGNGE